MKRHSLLSKAWETEKNRIVLISVIALLASGNIFPVIASAKSLDEIISGGSETESEDGEVENEVTITYENENPEAEEVIDQFTSDDKNKIKSGSQMRDFQQIKEEMGPDGYEEDPAGSEKSAAEEQQEVKHKADDIAEWKIAPGESRITKRSIYIGSDVTKLEVFYTTGAQEPEIIFTSPNGNLYYAGQDVNYENMTFETRKGYRVTGYENISYYIIYFANVTDPGTWQMEAGIDEKTTEFFVVTAKPAQEWKNLNEEYKTIPTDAVLWYLSEDSTYTSDEEVMDIISKDVEIPETNNMKAVVHEEPPKKDPISTVLVLVILLIPAAGVGIFFIFRKMNKERQEHAKKKILNDNQRLKLRRKAENNRLDEYLNNNRYDYSDDFDIRKRAVLAKERVSERKNIDSEVFLREQERINLKEQMPDFVDDDYIRTEIDRKFSQKYDELDEMINFNYSDDVTDDLDDLDDFELEELDDDIELEELEEEQEMPVSFNKPVQNTTSTSIRQSQRMEGGQNNDMNTEKQQTKSPSFFTVDDDDDDNDEFF